MIYSKRSLGAVTRIFITFVIVGVASRAVPQMSTLQPATSNSDESAQTKIARALSPAPPDMAKAATVVEKDSQGRMTVLRDGTNGFTCMPGDPTGVGMPAMCEDEASRQWSKDFAEHKPKPTNTVPGMWEEELGQILPKWEGQELKCRNI